jgi:hypothetical protein
MEATAVFAATFAALYAGHHIGDYWAQTDHQARHKGDAGAEGRQACLLHVGTYVAVQAVCLALMSTATGWVTSFWAGLAALAVSALTHYAADRREHGLMFRVARLLPAVTTNFMKLGVPRAGVEIPAYPEDGPPAFVGDNPSLGTGTWALDQSWHLALGVFVPALILAAAA